MFFSFSLSLSLSLNHSMINQIFRKVQDWVAGTQSERRPFVGRPTENETRKALVETSGNVEDAVDVIYKNRKNKVYLHLEI